MPRRKAAPIAAAGAVRLAAAEFPTCPHHWVAAGGGGAARLGELVGDALAAARTPSQWRCATCGDREDLYLCVGCGGVHCGHNASGHAERHFADGEDARAAATPPLKRARGRTGTAATGGAAADGHAAALHGLVVSLTEPQAYCYRCCDWVLVDDDQPPLATVEGGGAAPPLSAARVVLAAVKAQLAGAPHPSGPAGRGPALLQPPSLPPGGGSAAPAAAPPSLSGEEASAGAAADARATTQARKGGAKLVPGHTGMVK